MLMAVDGPYALMVQPDDILISPREVDEHFGTMACFHPRYALGDSHNYMDKDDFLREMYLDTVGHDEAGLKRYEHMVNIVGSRFRHGPKTEERAVDDAMLKVISEKYITLPLYLMDHSGLAIPDNADKNILSSSAELIGEGKAVAYILKDGNVIAVVGYKE